LCQGSRPHGDDVLETNLIDFLADAMHGCDANDQNFHDARCVAGKHFLAELYDQPIKERRLP